MTLVPLFLVNLYHFNPDDSTICFASNYLLWKLERVVLLSSLELCSLQMTLF
ncbi:hypothetical protein TOT_030000322 [Theileria orientalis strain Shintoku]|uniref:Uncharacterized protein n=1 Tax=Theileria orientalis strain Shintoku TaxID=869250 RepID=J4C3U7_THEOR|nr:hypothetical protein TOT_030000322 [Theileria orientalis strain Shintoku]BAM41061.1 hypothetical protein TOT_030000322 [Theileria orientalis strain Shintoku]|eukprot:XP_009691362.1 hypothetical protein TOT_030000322 [Theileria orientalis strain Shintoku]